MNLAIVGAGIGGSTVLKTLLQTEKLSKNDLQIDVYDRKGQFTTGNPYSEESTSLLMNSADDDLGLAIDNQREFSEWLSKQTFQDTHSNEGPVYRHIFGAYLKDRFREFYESPLVEMITDKVTDLRIIENEQIQLATFKQGWINTAYDFVFLAIGHFPYSNNYGLKGESGYIHNPYPVQEQLANIKTTDRVGIIGSGASGIDMMRCLLDRDEFVHPVTFYIRNSFFSTTEVEIDEEIKTTLTFDWLRKHRHPKTGTIPLDSILKTIETDFEKYGIDWYSLKEQYGESRLSDNYRVHYDQPISLGRLQRYFVSIMDVFPHLYQSLTMIDQERLIQDYYPFMDHVRMNIPRRTIQRLFKALGNNQLRIVDKISDIKVNAEGSFDIYNENSYIETADTLINATGFEMDLMEVSKQSHLIHNLINRQLIFPHESGQGPFVSWPDTRLMTRRGQKHPISLLGHVIHATQLGNNNARLIAQQGKISALSFIDQYCDGDTR